MNQTAYKSILVVDDEEMIHKIIRPILMTAGYSVLAAHSGEEGLRIAREQKPDLIVLDVIMPGIKGREACRTLKEDPQTAEIPVIFLTSKESPDDIAAELAAGAVKHLTKPIDKDALLAAIQEVLG